MSYPTAKKQFGPPRTLHRIVAPVPLALLLGASGVDALVLNGMLPAARGSGLASDLLGWGVCLGFAVSVTGVREVFVRRIPADAFAWLAGHAACMHLGLLCALVSWLARDHGRAPGFEAVIGCAGTALLIGSACAGSVLARRCGLRR